jgi:cystathionine gamma-synthase
MAGPRTRVIFAETPTNPTLEVLDLSSLASVANRSGVPLAVDNTFATPYNQNPLLLGADLVIHSATKYLGGHSDLTAGVVLGSAERAAPVREIMKVGGGCADPLAAYLLQRGLKTLALRVRAQNENAAGVAAFLSSHPRVSRVFYPGLETHPGHAIARRQMRGYGGMVTFEAEGGFEAACRVMDRFRVFLRAATLGGVESNAMIPVLASHVGLSEEELSRAGVSRGMIRLSVGIEDLEDLVWDLDQALA